MTLTYMRLEGKRSFQKNGDVFEGDCTVSAMLLLQVLRKVSKEIIVYSNPNVPFH